MRSRRNGSLVLRPHARGWLAQIIMCIVLAVAGIVALRASSNAEAVLPGGGPATQVAASGLVLSLRVAPGPYFLSELLAVEMTLVNRSQTAYASQGVPTPNDCDQTMTVALTGGEAPHYTPPVQGIGYCPIVGSSTLKPGQMWTIVQMLPITASGYITLTAQANFLHMEKGADGSSYMTVGDGPFAGRWPEVHLEVTAAIPAGRTLTLDRSLPDRVMVSGPQEALGHLYAVYDVTCHSGEGYTEAPGYMWGPVTGNVLTRVECPGSDVVWKYGIGAPGYAIASGAYPPNG